MDDLMLGAYWKARGATLDDCVERTLATFEALAGLGDEARRWFRPAQSRKAALAQPVTIDAETVRALLLDGRNRDETTGEPIDELGYGLRLWNGEDPGGSVAVSCGKTTDVVSNSVVVRVTTDDARRWAVDGLAALVAQWDPERAIAVTTAQEDVLLDTPPGRMDAGWVTYVRGDAHPVGLPDGVAVERWNGGTAIVLPAGAPDDAVLGVRRALAG